MTSQRLTEKLLEYWSLSCKEHVIPEYSQFKSASIADIWKNCLTLAIQPSSAGMVPKFKFDYVGDALQSLFHEDPTGQYYNMGARSFPTLRVLGKMIELIETPAPAYDEGKFVNSNDKVVKFRCILLPFGKADAHITHIVAGLSWREF